MIPRTMVVCSVIGGREPVMLARRAVLTARVLMAIADRLMVGHAVSMGDRLSPTRSIQHLILREIASPSRKRFLGHDFIRSQRDPSLALRFRAHDTPQAVGLASTVSRLRASSAPVSRRTVLRLVTAVDRDSYRER